jgi:ADP-ribosyl-[dinitrogen reductase] hydrolase
MKTKLEKAQGMLVGLMVGDALGAPVEFGWSSTMIRSNWNGQMQDHRIPKGHYTDDTAMALCLADSLLECGGYNSYDVMNKYYRWANTGYRASENDGKPASDIGAQTASAIAMYTQQPVIRKNQPRHTGAGNGGIMRLAPAVIVSCDQPVVDAMNFAKITSRETHFSEEADAGAEVFSAMLWQALRLDDKQKVVDVSKYSTGETYDSVLQRAMFTKNLNDATELKDLGGYVVDAIKIAVWGFLNFDRINQGMLEVIRLGGDTDTNAAIYGQLAGAYYGHGAIPNEWIVDLRHHNDIKLIANRLFEQKPSKIIATRFEEDGSDVFREYGE